MNVNEPAVEALVAGHQPGDPDITVTQLLEQMSVGPAVAELTWYTNSFRATLSGIAGFSLTFFKDRLTNKADYSGQDIAEPTLLLLRQVHAYVYFDSLRGRETLPTDFQYDKVRKDAIAYVARHDAPKKDGRKQVPIVHFTEPHTWPKHVESLRQHLRASKSSDNKQLTCLLSDPTVPALSLEDGQDLTDDDRNDLCTIMAGSAFRSDNNSVFDRWWPTVKNSTDASVVPESIIIDRDFVKCFENFRARNDTASKRAVQMKQARYILYVVNYHGNNANVSPPQFIGLFQDALKLLKDVQDHDFSDEEKILMFVDRVQNVAVWKQNLEMVTSHPQYHNNWEEAMNYLVRKLPDKPSNDTMKRITISEAHAILTSNDESTASNGTAPTEAARQAFITETRNRKGVDRTTNSQIKIGQQQWDSWTKTAKWRIAIISAENKHRKSASNRHNNRSHPYQGGRGRGRGRYGRGNGDYNRGRGNGYYGGRGDGYNGGRGTAFTGGRGGGGRHGGRGRGGRGNYTPYGAPFHPPRTVNEVRHNGNATPTTDNTSSNQNIQHQDPNASWGPPTQHQWY